MNHSFVYDAIIQNAKSQVRSKKDAYYEKHHIVPRCLEGTNENNNLVLLTAKEHYLCHKLLTYIYKGNRKLICAFNLMTIDKRNRHNISARDYEYAKNLMKEFPPKSHYDTWVEKYGKEEADAREKNKIAKIKATMTGVTYSKERRANAAKGHIGITMSKESSDKKSISMQGKNVGKIHTDETKQKISNAGIGRLLSEETKLKMRKPKTDAEKEKMKITWQRRKGLI